MSSSAEDKQQAFLRRTVEPSQTAVVTMELQEGVVGPLALLPALADEVARAGTLTGVRRVIAAARSAGVRVVHNTALARPDGAGAVANCKIFALGARMRRQGIPDPTEIGSPGAELVAGISAPEDIVVSRIHGMTPFTSTSLDQVLRNCGVRTVVAVGVSVNLGILGLALNAVDLGYQVVVVRDAVAGVPAEYAEAVLEHSLSMLATIVTAAELEAAWAPLPAAVASA
jgi:nicotinamidase-related amidase